MVGYTLLLSVIEYKTLVMRGDMDAAAEILPQIPQARARAFLPKRSRRPPRSVAQGTDPSHAPGSKLCSRFAPGLRIASPVTPDVHCVRAWRGLPPHSEAPGSGPSRRPGRAELRGGCARGPRGAATRAPPEAAAAPMQAAPVEDAPPYPNTTLPLRRAGAAQRGRALPGGPRPGRGGAGSGHGRGLPLRAGSRPGRAGHRARPGRPGRHRGQVAPAGRACAVLRQAAGARGAQDGVPLAVRTSAGLAGPLLVGRRCRPAAARVPARARRGPLPPVRPGAEEEPCERACLA